MLRIFNLEDWWKLKHDKEQMDMFGHIEFFSVRGFRNLFVADVTEEEQVVLILMGCKIDQTVAFDYEGLKTKNRMIHKDNDKNEYCIIEVHYSTIENKS